MKLTLQQFPYTWIDPNLQHNHSNPARHYPTMHYRQGLFDIG